MTKILMACSRPATATEKAFAMGIMVGVCMGAIIGIGACLTV